MKGNSKCMNQNAAQNVLPVNEIAQLWLSFYKKEKAVVVYGMHELPLKIHRIIVVVDRLFYFYTEVFYYLDLLIIK
jgi:hypothetical protein